MSFINCHLKARCIYDVCLSVFTSIKLFNYPYCLHISYHHACFKLLGHCWICEPHIRLLDDVLLLWELIFAQPLNPSPVLQLVVGCEQRYAPCKKLNHCYKSLIVVIQSYGGHEASTEAIQVTLTCWACYYHT